MLLLLLLDCVRGALVLTTVNKIPKVTLAGTLGNSAITDDGTDVLLAARGLILDNAKPIQQKNAAGTVRNVLVHFSDDVVYLDNADGSVSIRPKAGSLLLVSTSADVTGNANVSGVYKVAGVQVVGPQLAAVAAPSGGGTAVSAPSGGGVIDAQARAAIVSIIAAISSAGNTVDPAARTAINDLRSRLSTTGITA